VTLALLDQELYEVSEWFHLGLHLGVPAADLQTIDYEPTLHRIPQHRVEIDADSTDEDVARAQLVSNCGSSHESL